MKSSSLITKVKITVLNAIYDQVKPGIKQLEDTEI